MHDSDHGIRNMIARGHFTTSKDSRTSSIHGVILTSRRDVRTPPMGLGKPVRGNAAPAMQYPFNATGECQVANETVNVPPAVFQGMREVNTQIFVQAIDLNSTVRDGVEPLST